MLWLKLFFLQILNTEYKYSAESISQRTIIQYPARGLIYDRNGELLVANQPAYDIRIDRFKINEFDTAELCRILEISKKQVEKRITKAKRSQEAFLEQVSPEDFAIFNEKLHIFPGFYAEPRTLRKYNQTIAANILGYVLEVDSSDIIKDDYYQVGDYIGKSGIEKTYEKELRGQKGKKVYFVDVQGRIKGPYKDGKLDVDARVGNNIACTIDAELQAYGEKLMSKFVGSIVAIEPATGEILALVTSPGYNPSLLVGRKRSQNFPKLRDDTLKPLFNRALMAQYPPGSTFKAINGAIGLQENVISTTTSIYVEGAFVVGNFVQLDHVVGLVDFKQAIQQSSNAYFSHTFLRLLNNDRFDSFSEAYTNWREHLLSFGFAQRLGIDLPTELKGNVPPVSYYENIHGKGWKPLNIISLAIGQGELLTTPLQMANMTAAVGNKGFYYTPHIVKSISNHEISRQYQEKRLTTVDKKHFDAVVDGMHMVVNTPKGTAYNAALPDIEMCGKTGTSENPHGQDHSIFIAFAPKENPKIAMSVYIENGGFGSIWAAPVAALMTEKYLKDTISNPAWETRILNADLNKQ